MKVLIVDDDYNIIDMIKRMIPWEELHITKVLEAENGRQAMSIINENDPDIIISDIEMPVMDGIHLAEAVANDDAHNPEIIFLTCHADFEYAKQAVHYGVCEYLLKPFPIEEMIAVLSKTIIRRNEKLQIESVSESRSLNKYYARRSFIRDVFDGNINAGTEEIVKAADKRGVAFDADVQYRIIGFGIDYSQAGSEFSRADLTFIFKNIANEVLFDTVDDTQSGFVDYSISEFYTTYIALEESEYDRYDFTAKVRRINEVLGAYLEMGVTCIISESVSVDLFAETKLTIEHNFLQSISYSGVIIELENSDSLTAHVEGHIAQFEIENYIRDRKKNEYLSYLKNYLSERAGTLDATDLKKIRHELMQVFFGFLYESGLNSSELIDDENARKLQESAHLSSVAMIKYANYMFDYTVDRLERLKASEGVIERAKKFIAEHCGESIGRNEVAEHVGLAPNYLSMIFNKETGVTLREYVNECRVSEAKKLMDTTAMNVTEIALEVGFENISYFSTVFKKITGVTPADYKSKRK